MGAAMIEVTGTKTSGTNGADAVANYKTNTDSGTSLQVTMDAFADSNNRPVAFFSHRAASDTEVTDHEPGYTELHDGPHGSVMMGHMAEWHPTVAETTPSASWVNSGACGGFALEIAEADEAPWWNSSYQYRRKITVTNNSGGTVSVDTLVSFTTDTASLITGSKLRSDGNDWRIVYDNGSTQSEIGQKIESGWNTTSTETWFRLEAAINNGESDGDYYVYYGYSDESTSAASLDPAQYTNVKVYNQDSNGGNSTDLAFDALTSGEWGNAQGFDFDQFYDCWWNITKFRYYVSARAGGTSESLAGFIFDGINKGEGEEITNGKGDEFINSSVGTGWNGRIELANDHNRRARFYD